MLDRDAAVRNRQRVLQLLLLWQQHPNGSEQVEVYCWFAGSGLFWGSMPGKAGAGSESLYTSGTQAAAAPLTCQVS